MSTGTGTGTPIADSELSSLVSTFRRDFPEFANVTTYPASMINFWASLGDTMLNTVRWGDLRTHGLELFVAHNITLQAQDIADAAAGGIPGGGGLVASQSAGSVSVSMDTTSGAEQDGGNYNLTTYGKQFLRLSRIVGMGGAFV